MLSAKFVDPKIRYLADKYKIKFIVPDYPKSPEVVFPTAHDICVKCKSNTNDLRIARCSQLIRNLSLSGDSFGGHAVCM